jgi:hypothetical protein
VPPSKAAAGSSAICTWRLLEVVIPNWKVC